MIFGPMSGELDDDQILDAYPWPEQGTWVRAMMVTTLDGAAAGPDGLSGSISGTADGAVFDAVRRLADAVLVGAGTLRSERYGPLKAKPEDQARRAAAGQAPAPVLVFVSASLDLPWDEPVFAESSCTPIVVTGLAATADRLAEAERHCDVVRLDVERFDPAAVIAELERRGLRHIVCEGGPTLLHEIVAAGLCDEADITVSPMFAGTSRTPRSPVLEAVSQLTLAQVIAADSFLMARYLRPTS